MSENIILSMRGIKKSFGGIHALKGIDFEVEKGEIHALVGENGAGKSTIMKILAGELKQDEGTTIICGNDVTSKPTWEIEKLGLQVVHQVLNVVPSMTIGENILLGCPETLFGGILNKKKGFQKAENALRIINDKLMVSQKVGDLSASEKQLVVLARALVNKPKIIVLDEPTSRLGMEESEQLFKVIDNLKNNGVTIIYISHRLEEIYRLCDRITVMRDGSKIITQSKDCLSQEDLVGYMIGRKINDYFLKSETEKGDVVLKTKNISFENKLEDVSIEVRKGEVVGLIGAVGSGKSELLNIIFGAVKPDKGEVWINGSNNFKNPQMAIASMTALVPEDRQTEGLVGDFSIMENLTLADHKHLFKSGLIHKNKEKENAESIVKKLNIKPAMPQLSVKSLSGGNAQKVVIGKWITQERCIYLMDEVTAGIDVGAKTEIYKIINQLTSKGAGVLVATSDINEAMGISDRILIMFKGRIVAEFSASEINKDKALMYVMGGKVS